MMRKYTAEKYIEATEKAPNPGLTEFMEAESTMLSNIPDPEDKTFIDLGAGHGRIIPVVAPVFKKVIGIELNQDMIPELKQRASKFENVRIIEGDMTKLTDLELPDGKKLFAILQNTLGTIEGSRNQLLKELKRAAQKDDELILSLFRAKALRSWGVELYTGISYMTGKPDMEKCDFENGLFVSDSGYTSKWWSDEDINELLNDLQVTLISERHAAHYRILHLKFTSQPHVEEV